MSLLLAQIGGVSFTGSGSLASTPSTSAASGSLRFSGIGAITGSSSSISASGSLLFIGTGAILSTPSTISSTGTIPAVADQPSGGSIKNAKWGGVDYTPNRPKIKHIKGIASVKSSASKIYGLGFLRSRFKASAIIESRQSTVSGCGKVDSGNHDALLASVMLEM